jgi:hypothetical protein
VKIQVVMVAEFTLTDAWQLSEAPGGKGPALKHGSRFYQPTLDWLKRKFDFSTLSEDEYEGPLTPIWVTVDDPVASEWLMPAQMKCRIKSIR